MRFPLGMTAKLSKYIAGKWLRRVGKFPLVMMLEPLYACNLTCTGCGRIREYKETIKEQLTVEHCLEAVEECGAPIVSICGGEPMIYRELGQLVTEILDRGKHIYLCTNGMFIQRRLKEFQPTSQFFFNVHLDGLEATHDLCVQRKGVFRQAIGGIRAAKAAGFMVCTNTTIYKQTDLREIAELFEYLKEFRVDGHTIAPSYSYAAVQNKEIFMSRQEIQEKFRLATKLLENYALMTSPIYLDYLRGEREDLMCTAWGNPTYNPGGWKAPCYLITDGHHVTFKDFLEKTNWGKYGRGRDPRCEHCMVHVGYEPSAVLGANRRLRDTWRLLKWQLSGGKNGRPPANGEETEKCSPLLPARTDSSEVT
jgi:hopanoid biosynthesis associated radical SAM protein HpnH